MTRCICTVMEPVVTSTSWLDNITDWNTTTSDGTGRRSFPDDGHTRVLLYAIIFVLAVAGNALVIATLAHDRRMRTVTNLFLLNLAVSDLLLAVLCMPFTLIPTLLKNFIFGKAMCILIRYMQGAINLNLSQFKHKINNLFLFQNCKVLKVHLT